MRRNVIALVLLAGASCAMADCSPLATQYFPPALVKAATEDHAAGLPGTMRCDSVSLGGDFVVAAYTASDAGGVRVLRGTGDAVVYEVPYHTMIGRAPGVELRDLDHDGKPEVVVSFTDDRGTAVYWLFRWTGVKLELISPSSEGPNGEPQSVLTDVRFVDVDGDGTLAVIDEKIAKESREDDGSRSVDQVLTMFVLHDGVYGNPRPIRYLGTFTRGKRAPQTKQIVITGEAGACDCTLRVINGGPAGSAPRVSSATIRLDGAVVVSSAQLNQKVSVLSVPVKLSPVGDTLSVLLSSEPGSQLTIVIGPQL